MSFTINNFVKQLIVKTKINNCVWQALYFVVNNREIYVTIVTGFVVTVDSR